MNERKSHITLFACVLLAGLATAVQAESDPEDIIKYRQNVMKANGAHMAAIGAILQGKVEYPDQLGDHAKAVVDINREVHKLFPKGSDFGDTRALDAVWTRRPAFDKAAKVTEEKSAALLKAVQTKDMKTAGARFKELQDSCKACHKDFRREEKE